MITAEIAKEAQAALDKWFVDHVRKITEILAEGLVDEAGRIPAGYKPASERYEIAIRNAMSALATARKTIDAMQEPTR